MKKAILIICVLALVLGISMMAQAGLQTVGTATYNNLDFNLIYDTDSYLIWLDYTHTSTPSWDGQNSWASGLNDAGVLTYNLNDGFTMNWSGVWRLPTITDIGNDGCNFGYSSTDCGYNVDTSTGELAHLFHDELGNQSRYDENGVYRGFGNFGLQNTGDFERLVNSVYWTDTGNVADEISAWGFNMADGEREILGKSGNRMGIAVRSGQLTVVPEPVSSILFILGGVAMGFRRFCKKTITN